MPLIPALRRWRQFLYEIEAILVNIVSVRLPRATGDPISKNKKGFNGIHFSRNVDRSHHWVVITWPMPVPPKRALTSEAPGILLEHAPRPQSQSSSFSRQRVDAVEMETTLQELIEEMIL